MNAEHLREKLDKQLMDPKILLGTAKFLTPSAKESPLCGNSRYFPFYYYLGTLTSPQTVVQIGSRLGLVGNCFMQGCKTVTSWLALDGFAYGNHPPVSVIKNNLQMHCTGAAESLPLVNDNLKESGEPYIDMGIISEKYDPEDLELYLEFFWRHIKPEGLLVVDYIAFEAAKQVFNGFCRVKNREPDLFDTHYGVGIVTR